MVAGRRPGAGRSGVGFRGAERCGQRRRIWKVRSFQSADKVSKFVGNIKGGIKVAGAPGKKGPGVNVGVVGVWLEVDGARAAVAVNVPRSGLVGFHCESVLLFLVFHCI